MNIFTNIQTNEFLCKKSKKRTLSAGSHATNANNVATNKSFTCIFEFLIKKKNRRKIKIRECTVRKQDEYQNLVSFVV